MSQLSYCLLAKRELQHFGGMMNLKAVSPIDGRYRDKVIGLSNFFSEYALIKFRIKTEISFLLKLSEEKLIPSLKGKEKQLQGIYEKFDETKAAKIKEIEQKTNHDVKAVEYYLKEELEKIGLKGWSEWVHFGLTSED